MTDEELRKEQERISKLSPEELQAEIKSYEPMFRELVSNFMDKMFGAEQSGIISPKGGKDNDKRTSNRKP